MTMLPQKIRVALAAAVLMSTCWLGGTMALFMAATPDMTTYAYRYA